MGRMQNKLDEVMALTKSLRKDYPTETNAFLGFLSKAESGKALGIRDKELINVALGVAAQCEWCIAFHVEQAARAGASRDEIMEAGFMAVIMHGGPAYMYLTPLLDAINEFLPEAS
ncbi:AhpD family alkylhydroperoxidase [Thiogranum longum]|uniref:AhpD family alkylhydroperoxidase n=1 Tax=Thiogranum longum TaxID=1537524 RepID=A0A4R1H7E3_9GAMM|nr:carboxymuconolactone decarboxylase family protein [Thiogranum longum]TCK17737.1 AhpD family alkylhydroperoxidase [Thiogranum longum]